MIRLRWIGLSALLAFGCGGGIFYLPAPEGSGREDTGGGVEPPLRLAWERKLDAPPAGGAVFAGGVVLQLTAASSLYALDLRTGRLLGKKEFGAPPCGAPVGAGVFFAADRTGKEAALFGFDRLRGKMRWRVEGLFCAPLASRGDTLLAAGEDGFVRAVRIDTGEELWRFPAGRVRTAPAWGAGAVYVGNGEGTLFRLDAAAGRRRWRRDLGEGIRSGPVVRDGKVFAATAGGRITALDAASGKPIWMRDIGSLPTPGMAFAGRILAVGAVDRRLYGIDAGSGDLKWRFETKGVIRGTPAAAGRTVYCAGADGRLCGLDAESGRLVWEAKLDGPVTAPIVLGAGAVGVATEKGRLYVFVED